MDKPSATGTERRADLSEFVSRYRRHVPILLASTIAGGALLAAVTTVLPKYYTATAQMTYAPQALPDVRNNQTPMATPLSDVARGAQVDASVTAVGSLQVASRVVQTLNLKRDLDLLEKAQKYAATGDQPGALATALLEGLKVRRVGETALIDVSYTSKDPLTATKVANAFGQAYVEQQALEQQTQSQNNSSRLDSSAAQLAQQARDADAAVARFKLENNLVFNPSSPNIGQDIASISSSLADARAQLAESSARSQFVRSGGTNDLAGNSALASLRDQQAQVSRNFAVLQARYGGLHPKVNESRRELADISQQVAAEVGREASSATAQARFAAQRVSSLQASLDSSRQRQISQVAAATQLEGLQRQADTANQLYNNMLANSGQEAAKRAVLPPETTLTTLASPPFRPSSPIMPLNIVVGLLLGLGLGIAIAYTRERWSVGLTSNDDIERVLGQTFLNSLPTLDSSVDNPSSKDPVEALLAHPLSLYAEAYRSLATSLRMVSPDVKVIGVTSALPKEGKTTCAINMALTMALAGERVLLMDCDLRRRSVTTNLAPGSRKGLNEVVRGEATVAEAVFVHETGLHLLPLAPQAHLGAQPFGTPAFGALMRDLRGSYDLIVIDTAPVLAVVDVRLLLAHIDSLGLLARWRKTPIRAIRAAVHQIETVGGKIAGVAMSLVDVNAQANVGYGDASQYYSEMKDYYSAT
jgi:polysaccharide biosynthesis transport protein